MSIKIVLEKLEISNFRSIQNRFKDVINVELITSLLISKGLVFKSFGLCAEPNYNFFEICHTNDRGVSFVAEPLNTVHVKLNSNHTTKKTTYFNSITIHNINGYYYLCCLAQSSSFKESVGAKNITYKVAEDRIGFALDKIFKHVEPNDKK